MSRKIVEFKKFMLKIAHIAASMALPLISLAQNELSESRLSEPIQYVILDTLITDYYFSVWYTENGDTVVKATHSPIDISTRTTNRLQKTRYDKLQKKVIKTYPYAKAAGDVMRTYEALCLHITDEGQRKEMLDKAEKHMMKQFEKDLRNMTVSEGVILVKLIDRQTGETGYELLQQLKGKFSAFMWQSIARIFGQNLKDDYDGSGEDVWIENIVALIEDGTIPVADKSVDPFGVGQTIGSNN
jgi:hypothetical protein